MNRIKTKSLSLLLLLFAVLIFAVSPARAADSNESKDQVTLMFGTLTGSTYTANQTLTQTVDAGSVVVLPTLKRSGYVGTWRYRSDGRWVSQAFGSKVTACKNIRYSVYWQAAKKVTYYYGNGKLISSLTQTVAVGKTAKMPAGPSKSMYVFLGWSKKAGSTEVAYKKGTAVKVTANLKLYAVYKKTPTVRLFTNTGKLYKSYKYTSGMLFPDVDPGNNTTFCGWSKKKGTHSAVQYYSYTKIPAAGDYYMVTADESDIPAFSNSSLPKSSRYETVYFVGDSRTVFMSEMLGGAPEGSVMIGKVGQGLSWLKSSRGGYAQLISHLKANKATTGTKRKAVIFNLGVNDLSNYASYASYLNKIEVTLRTKYNCDVYFMTVGPVNLAKWINFGISHIKGANASFKGGNRTNARVITFNKYMKKHLKSRIRIIDEFALLTKTGYATYYQKYKAADGLHYTKGVYQRIFKYAIQTIG